MENLIKKTLFSQKNQKIMASFLLCFGIIFSQPMMIFADNPPHWDDECPGGTCEGDNPPHWDDECWYGECEPIPPICIDECFYSGQRKCACNTQYQICGDYDDDPCLEWSSPINCPSGQVCQNGQCVSTCSNECSYSGQTEKRCSGNYLQKRTCGNYDSDSCLEWSSWQNEEDCGSSGWTENYRCLASRYLEREYINRGCSNNQCFATSEWRDYQDCGTDSWTNNYRCSGNWVQREKIKKGCSNNSCYNFSQWENWQNCEIEGKICQQGQCVLPPCSCTSWSGWQDLGCGQGGCAQNQMWQERIRSCNPPGCAIESERRCIFDSRCQVNDPVSGTLTSSCTSACTSEYLTFTISAQDDQGVEKVCLNSDCQICNWQTFCQKSWQITKNTPGNYTFSGTLYGKKPDGSSESASTNPPSITVQFRQCCSSHYTKKCYDNDLYWYDSCNQREEKYQECGDSDWQDEYQCSSSRYLQRKWINRGCLNNQCFATSEWRDYQDCQAFGKICQQGQCVLPPPTCQDECSPAGQKDCSGSSGRTCGNYDSDPCLEWSSWQSCASWCYFCGDSRCNSECGENSYNCSQDCGPSCYNECSFSGQRSCLGTNAYQVCGNYDSDPCLEWSGAYYCGSGQICLNGYCQPSCNDECSFSGQKRCSSSTHYQVCGNYDSDPCLEWSSGYYCTGNTNCGYGNCNNDQRPEWYCSGGECTYRCYYDSTCQIGYYIRHSYKACYDNDVWWYDSNDYRTDKYEECGSDYCQSWGEKYCLGNSIYQKRTCYDKGCRGSSCYSEEYTEKKKIETCASNEKCQDGECVRLAECISGPCCENGKFKDSSAICDVKVDTEYGCPWGTSCGADVGKRTRVTYQYCSGKSAKCTGKTKKGNWSNWIVADSCGPAEICLLGQKTCQYSQACNLPSYYQHSYKSCYENSLWWYDSKGQRQEKYKDCDDENSCTIDSCSGSKCINELKCDGSTCQIGSTDYCSSCKHCGDDICNCQEGPCSCQEDCGFSAVILSQLVRKKGDSSWAKSISLRPGDSIEFLINLTGAGVNPLREIILKTELPKEIDYQNQLFVDGILTSADISQGFKIEELVFGQTKTITFEGKAREEKEFKFGRNKFFIQTIANYNGKTSADSVEIEVLKKAVAFSRAGILFSYFGDWLFWLGVFLLLVAAFIIWLLYQIIFRKRYFILQLPIKARSFRLLSP